jgi:hypothetical protein
LHLLLRLPIGAENPPNFSVMWFLCAKPPFLYDAGKDPIIISTAVWC